MATKTNAVPPMPGFVFVLIRFPLHRVDACRNALMKNYSVNKAYAGSTSGVSRRIQAIEGGWPEDKGVAVLLFCNHREAELWKDSVPEIRQQDWLDGVDLIIVPVRCQPHSASVETSSMDGTTEAHVVEGNNSVSQLFKYCAILTGFVGVVTNGVVLVALLANGNMKQTVNLFIVNQVALDLYSSAFLAICHTIKLFPILHDGGKVASFLCAVFDNDLITYVGVTGSIISLVLIAAERYFLIVHPILHKTHVNRRMIVALVTIPWIEGLANNLPGFWTSAVVDGVCFKFYFWPSKTSQVTYSICIILLTFFVPLALLVFFYGSVLLAVRRRAQVFQSHYVNQDMSTVLQANANRAQMNIISTMIIVSVAFVVCWFPSQIWYLFLIIQVNVPNNDTFQSVSVFLIFLNICLNPFIYATKLAPVKKKLRGWLPRPTSTLITTA